MSSSSLSILSIAFLVAAVACGGAAPPAEEEGTLAGAASTSGDHAATEAPFRLVTGVTPPEGQSDGEVAALAVAGNRLYAGRTAMTGGGAPILVYDIGDDGVPSFASAPSDVGGIHGVRGLLAFSGGERLLAISAMGGPTGSPSVLLERDGGTGQPSLLEELEIGGFHSSAVSPDGGHLYTVPPRDNTIRLFHRSDDGASYRQGEEFELGVTSPNESGTSQLLAMGPEGRHLYATTNKKYDEERELIAGHRLYVYERDPGTGTLSEVEFHEDGEAGVDLEMPKSLAVSPDGTMVLVGSSTFSGGSVSAFTRNPGDGTLAYEATGELEAGDFLPEDMMARVVSPQAIAFVPGSDRFLVAADDTNAIVVYAFR